jgi:hypothetical protein
MKEYFLQFGRRWLEMTAGQRKFVVVVTIAMIVVIDVALYLLYQFAQLEHLFLPFETVVLVQVAMTALSFVTIGLAANAARRKE